MQVLEGEDARMFLDAIEIDAEALPAHYPFTVPVIETLRYLEFQTPVTFFVGENGSGKSSLLEAIACGLKCPTVGAADVRRDPLLAEARELAKEIRFIRRQNAKLKLFFRAEDAIGFTRRVSEDLKDLEQMAESFERELTGEGRDRAVSTVRGQQQGFIQRYGDNPDAFSHGEWFVNMLRERIHRPGLYLLDEPETPLSPVHQLTLLAIIQDVVKDGAQFIIATHSPILMALPGATILSFDSTEIQPVAWDEVEHVAILRAFLADPASYLRHL